MQLCWTSSNDTEPTHQSPNAVLIITMHSHPLNAMFLCICNVMHHCMSMPCHICNEWHMDNIIHTFYHVSWTIILHAYNFQIITHSNVNTLKHNISTFYPTTIIKHVITNQVITHLTLKADCGIYNAHKKKGHTSSLKSALKMAIELAKQAFNSPNHYYFFISKQSLNTF